MVWSGVTESAGKRQGSGAAPNGASLSSTPARATSSHSRAWAFG